MTTLRVRFRLNPGRKGISLSRLSKQAENIESFLRSLASDVGADGSKNLWLADRFSNGSAIFTSELQALVDAEKVASFNTAMHGLRRYKTTKSKKPPLVSESTMERFASLRESLDDDETIGIGLYDPETGRAKPFGYVDKVQLSAIAASIETEFRYVGAVMGYTHEWNMGAEKPYLYLREINTGDLVKCSYRNENYDRVAHLFTRKGSLVVIEGSCIYSVVTLKTEVESATHFEFAPDLADDDFERFFGSAPGLTSDLSAAEIISKGRYDEQ